MYSYMFGALFMGISSLYFVIKKQTSAFIIPQEVCQTSIMLLRRVNIKWESIKRRIFFVNWWENGISRRNHSWIARSYHLLTVHRAFKQSRRKLSLIGIKRRNSQMFPPLESFPLYHICILIVQRYIYTIKSDKSSFPIKFTHGYWQPPWRYIFMAYVAPSNNIATGYLGIRF